MRRFKTRRRVALTGSPFSNNLGEYYHMTDWARPDILGTRKEFANQFENPINEGRSSDATRADARRGLRRAHVLHKRLGGVVHRRDAAELQKSLPPKTECVLSVALSPTQRSLYGLLLAAAKKSRADVLAFNE